VDGGGDGRGGSDNTFGEPKPKSMAAPAKGITGARVAEAAGTRAVVVPDASGATEAGKGAQLV
jgi:hypothetical protein